MTQENITLKTNTPRNLFVHLLAIVTLYWSSISFITLFWQYINKFFPDNLNYFGYDFSSGLIRFHVSALIIVFPVFLATSWYLNKLYRKESRVRESKIRKWLLYLTLFVASLVIICDLIGTINALLGGEITIRFILKALSIFLVAGLIFGYYLDDVKRDIPSGTARYFAWGTSVVVLVVIITAFFVIGSPTTARLIQFDQQRISDLQGIQAQIVNYWQGKEKLPGVLSDLNDSISGFKVPIDPQTNVQYEYIVTDLTNLSFYLCANFNKQSLPETTRMLYPIWSDISQNWDHAAGRVCFERTIDRQLYPVKK